MKRALLLAPLLLLGACRDNGASIEIVALCAPPKNCTFTNKCDTIALGNPVLDPSVLPTTGIPNSLSIVVQLDNQMPDNGDKTVGRTNSNDAHIDEIVVEYGGALSGRIVMGAQGTIKANDAGLVYFDLIPSAVAAAFPWSAPDSLPKSPQFTEVSTKTRMRGYLDDGTRFETAEYPLTVEVTHGGVVTCPGSCPHAGQWPNGGCP